MAANRGKRRSVKPKRAGAPRLMGGAGAKPSAELEVDAVQRQHLIEACAFFRADHFRPVKPGGYRRQDLRDAAIDVDDTLSKHKCR